MPSSSKCDATIFKAQNHSFEIEIEGLGVFEDKNYL
jgi:2'-5' RNA ligase